MADNNLEIPTFSNFSIESTMEVGDKQLLEDLISPETSTDDPDEIEKIDDTPKKVTKKPVKKVEKPIAEEEEEEEEEAPKDKTLAELLQENEEEEEEEEIIVKKKTSDNEEEEEPIENNQFKALSKDLFKLNVFTKGEDEEEEDISTPEQFLERFNLEKRKGAIETINNFIGQFGEDYQNAFQAIFVKGVDPKDYFGTYNTIENYASLDMSNESNQVAVIRQALKDQGFESEDIESEIERFKNYGDLETIAQKHHKVLVKKEANKLAELEQEKENELELKQAQKQQYFKNVQTVLEDKLKAKEFDGIPLNPKLANELQDFLLTDKYKTSSGETLTDFDRTILDLKRPENHEKKVKVALLLKLLETDPTLSTIQKSGISKKTNTLFKEVVRSSVKTPVKSAKAAPAKSWFSE